MCFNRENKLLVVFRDFDIAKLFVLFIFISLSINSYASDIVFKVRDHKFYREIMVDQKRFFINKKSLDVYFSVKEDTFNLSQSKELKNYTFEKRENERTLSIYVKEKSSGEGLVGFQNRKSSKFYQSEICTDVIEVEKKMNLIASDEFIDKIYGLEIENLFDKESCKKISRDQFEKFKEILIDVFIRKQNSLSTCMNSDPAAKIFAADPVLKKNSDETFRRYLLLVDSIASGSSNMKLKCGMEPTDRNKIASFQENPLVIAINLVNQKFNLDISETVPTLGHELMHYGMQQSQLEKKPSCLDEGFVNLLERVCTYSPGVGEAPPHSSQVVKSCLDGKNLEIKKTQLNANGGNTDSLELTLAAVESMPKDNQQEHEKVTNALENQLNSGQVKFEPVSPEAVKVVATAPVLTTSGKPITADGKFHQVVPDSDFSSSFQKLNTAFSSNLANANFLLGSALNTAGAKFAGAVAGGNKAVASSGAVKVTAVTGKYSGMVPAQVFANRYYPDSTDSIGNPKLASMSYDQKQKYFEGLAAASSKGTLASGGAMAGDSRSGKPGKTSSQSGGNAGEASLAQSATSSSGSAGNMKGSNGATRQVASVDASGGAGSKKGSSRAGSENAEEKQDHSAASESTRPSNLGSAQSASVVPPSAKAHRDMAQRLTAFNEVKEPAYSKIANQLDNRDFLKQLDARRIRIVGKDGKPLWFSSTRPGKCFEDDKDGKTLKQVACR